MLRGWRGAAAPCARYKRDARRPLRLMAPAGACVLRAQSGERRMARRGAVVRSATALIARVVATLRASATLRCADMAPLMRCCAYSAMLVCFVEARYFALMPLRRVVSYAAFAEELLFFAAAAADTPRRATPMIRHAIRLLLFSPMPSAITPLSAAFFKRGALMMLPPCCATP